jgi:hypothetical protein
MAHRRGCSYPADGLLSFGPTPAVTMPEGGSRKDRSAKQSDEIEGIVFIDYKDESQLASVMSLVDRDLSEPYSSELMI